MNRIRTLPVLLTSILVITLVGVLWAQETSLGYYRFPTISGDAIFFTAEGDIWRVGLEGGAAQRLTTHPAEESHPAVSPDGSTLAYSASYEGPTEVYTMALAGGVPERRTYEGGRALVVGWTPGGRILYSTRRYSALPNTQLLELDPVSGDRTPVPLAQASDGAYDRSGKSMFFTRFPFQGSNTKRYEGGTAQNLWVYAAGAEEAKPLTSDYAGTSKTPMVWQGRVYFLSDRDGMMNLWSMTPAGDDLQQHTFHKDFDLQSPALSEGRIVYQHGADIRLYDIARQSDVAVPVRLVSDFDHLRERWVKKPMQWVTAAHISPDGSQVVLTARGQVFVVPARQGRIVEATRNKRVRYRKASFLPDGKSLLVLSDKSGEVEFWKIPANGVGVAEQLTNDAEVLRWEGVASPDGKYIAHHDKNQQLWLYDMANKKQRRLAVSDNDYFGDLRWSPNSRWLAYTATADNLVRQIFLYDVNSGKITAVTSDRYDSYSPAWSPDSIWLYFLSDRNIQSLVRSPWGARQPEPFFDHTTKIYHVALVPGTRSPFQPDDELHVKPTAADSSKTADAKGGGASTQAAKASASQAVDLSGIQTRILEVPAPPGNYGDLSVDDKRLYFVSLETSLQRKRTLLTLPVDNKGDKRETFLEEIKGYELSLDRKKVLLRKADDLYVIDAGAKAPGELAKNAVPIKDWLFSFDPRDEWRQMFVEAWRLERDYFYDRNMHGVDWPAMRDKYLPLVERVTDRAELSDVIAQMVGELSALHIFVYGGDYRRGPDDVEPASLGAAFVRDERAGGFRVEHVYRSDPDIPEQLSPLARPEVDVHDGDVITAVNGVPTLGAKGMGDLLRGRTDKQVLLHIKPKGGGVSRAVVVTPISMSRESDLRYDEWEYTRRLAVEEQGKGRIGYVHLRAMGSSNISEWARGFYPVFNREGLIIDVRHNRGGNIDSWILEKLLRKAWFYWQPRVGNPTWNMQFAFRGHIVVLCDEFTASDGEAFAEGFRRLGLGKIIGTRTWGGEIWLSASNVLVDRGIATAAEYGVYGPEREWLIEGYGVKPDIVVDNPPHAAFQGEDAQLDAAINYLQEELNKNPVAVPPAPAYPDKSLRSWKGN